MDGAASLYDPYRNMRALSRVLLSLFVLIVAILGRAKADGSTQATLLNPQPNDTISVSLKPNAYRLNGTCFRADSVSVAIFVGDPAAGGVLEKTVVGVVRGNVWEADWTLPDPSTITAPVTRFLVVTPTLHDNNAINTGVFKDFGGNAVSSVSVKLESSLNVASKLPAGALNLVPRITTPGLFINMSQVATVSPTLSTVTLPLLFQARAITATDIISGVNMQYVPPSGLLTGAASLTTSLAHINTDADGAAATPRVPLNYTFVVKDAISYHEGLYQLQASYIDHPTAGANVTGSFYSRSVLLDITPPTVSISAPTILPQPTPTVPAGMSTVSQNVVRITGTAQDKPTAGGNPASFVSGIGSVTVLITRLADENRTAVSEAAVAYPATLKWGSDPGQPVAWSVDFTPANGGVYGFKVLASDCAGNSISDTSNDTIATGLYIDRTAPTGVSLKLDASAPTTKWVRGSVTLDLAAMDKAPGGGVGSGIASYQILDDLSGVPLLSGTGALPATYALDTHRLTDGVKHTLTLQVVDAQQNVTVSSGLALQVDNAAPGLTINTPAQLALIQGTQTIAATLTDTPNAADNVVHVNVVDDAGNTLLNQDFSSIPAAGTTVSASWVTLNKVPDGNHTVTFTATDTAGNQFVAKRTFVVNNSSPVVTIITPLVNTFLVGNVPVVASIADASGSVSWTIKVTNNTTSTQTTIGTGTGSTASATWNTAMLNAGMTSAFPDGPYTITVTATNALGQVGTATVNPVTVQNTTLSASFVTPTTPANGSVVQNTAANQIKLKLQVTGSVVSFRLSQDGTVVFTGAASDLVASAHTYSVPTTVADGPHTWLISATDTAGRTVQSLPLTLTIDNTNPVVALTTPANSAYVSGIVQITGSVTETNLASWTLSDGATTLQSDTTGSSVVNFSWNTAGKDGSHTLTLKAVDKAGNSGTTSVTVTVDNTAPTAVFAPPTPADGAFVRSMVSPVTIAATITEINLKSWQLCIDGAVTSHTGTTATVNVPLAAAELTDQQRHTYQIKVTDKAGNVGQTEVRAITIDNVPPVPVLSTPTNGQTVRGKITVAGSVGDNYLASWSLVLDSATVATTLATGTTASVQYLWDTTLVSDGTHTLTLSGMDKAGNSAAVTVTVVVANTVSGVTWVAPPTPASGSFIQYLVTVPLTLKAQISFPPSNLASWALTMDAAPVANGVAITDSDAAGNNYITNVLTPSTTPGAGQLMFAIPDGTHVFQISTTDKAGSVATNSLSLTIDNTPPTAALTAPANNAFVSGAVPITGSVADINLASWTLCDGNTVLTTDATGNTVVNYSWDTTGKDGVHTLILKAVDKAGNTVTTSVSVTVDNTSPVVVFAPPTPAADAFVNSTGNPVTVTATITEVNLNSWQLYIDGVVTKYTGTTASVSVPLTMTDLPDQQRHTYQIKVTDKAGNIGQTEVRAISIDNVSPVVVFAAPTPAEGSFINTVINPITIAGNITELNLKSWTLCIDGVATGYTGTTNSVNVALKTSDLTDQQAHKLQIKVVDKAGNTGQTETRSITVDNVNPTATLTSPTDGAVVGGVVTVTGTVGDTYLANWVLYDNGAQIATGAASNGATSSAVSFAWDTTNKAKVPDGTHVLKLTGIDKAGNQTSTSVTVTTSNSRPVVKIVSPQNNSNVGGMVAFEGTIVTNVSTKLTYQATVAGIAISLTPVSPQSVAALAPLRVTGTVDLSKVANGTYPLTLTATDEAGNTSSDQVSINIFSLAPVAQLQVSTGTLLNNADGQPVTFDPMAGLYVDANNKPAPLVYTRGLNGRVDLLGTAKNNVSWLLSGFHDIGALGTASARNTDSATATYVNAIDTSKFAGQTPPFDTVRAGSFPFVMEGRYQFALSAVNGSGQVSQPATLDLTYDLHPPVVTILTPTGTNYLAPPGSLLAIRFSVGKPKHKVSSTSMVDATNAPIVRYIDPQILQGLGASVKFLNAPDFSMTIKDLTTGQMVTDISPLSTKSNIRYSPDPAAAIKMPNDQKLDGTISVLGDQFNGYSITWQIRMLAKYFAPAHTYQISITGVHDAAGNLLAQPSQAQFLVNIQ